MSVVDLLCRRPGLLGWPVDMPPAPTIQKNFPLLSGQVADLAIWDSQNYWLVKVLLASSTDFVFERAVYECVSLKTAFEAELGKPAPEPLVLPVVFVARHVHEPLVDWAFQLGVYVKCVDLDGPAAR